MCIASANLEEKLTELSTINRPLRRNIKSVDQVAIGSVVTTAPSKKVPSNTSVAVAQAINNANLTLGKCVHSINVTEAVANLTISQKNESQLPCNRTIELHTLSNDNIKNKNITDQELNSSNMSSYFVSTKAPQMDDWTGMSGLSMMGITLGVILLVGLICVVSFVLYRRGFMNKPQTLNDKGSNLDSSGYIDDSSIRVK